MKVFGGRRANGNLAAGNGEERERDGEREHIHACPSRGRVPLHTRVGRSMFDSTHSCQRNLFVSAVESIGEDDLFFGVVVGPVVKQLPHVCLPFLVECLRLDVAAVGRASE